MTKSIMFIFLFASLCFSQTSSLTVTEGDTIEFHATEVTTLDDGNPFPSGNVLLYHLHITYENGIVEKLIHNDRMSFPDGFKVIVEANATGIIGTHRIEAWSVRLMSNGDIPSEKTILALTVEPKVDDRPPAKWIITIHPKGE